MNGGTDGINRLTPGRSQPRRRKDRVKRRRKPQEMEPRRSMMKHRRRRQLKHPVNPQKRWLMNTW